MLPERRMEYIYHEIVMLVKKQRRRSYSCHLNELWTAFPTFTIDWLLTSLTLYLLYAMAEKIERIELYYDSKDKVSPSRFHSFRFE